MRQLDVYLHNEFIGILKENRNGNLSFRYNPGISVKKTLSVRMPVSDDTYNDKYTRPFFENVLPEANIRLNVADLSNVSSNNIFSLLKIIGEDCAGAVTLLDKGQNPENLKDIKPRKLSKDELIRVITRQDTNPLLTEFKKRLSLAGAQKKLALTILDENYYLPGYNNPTTHIIKPTNPEFAQLIYNEDFCMRLAGLLGLNVAKTDICHIENVPFLKISRYDRKKLKNRIEKLHQEDFCQATGTVSSKKYQKEGGPSFRECLNIIREHSNIAGKDSISILKWLVFNILICNHDGHAKNISLLHDENEGIRLAPFYDLVCTGIYPMLSSEMAMRIGKVYDWSKIRRSDLNELTDKVNIKKRLINTIIDQMCDEIVLETEKLINRLTNKYGDIKVYEKIRDMIRIGVDNLA